MCTLASAAAAQKAPVILTLPGSTRALALGNSYTVGSTDADAIFYNPVLLLSARGLSMSLQRYGSDGTLATFGSAIDLNLGIGIQVLDYLDPSFASRPASGFPLDVATGEPAGQAVFTAGYARVVKKIRVGVAAKRAQHWGGSISDGVWAFDVGTQINPMPWLFVAVAGRNLGSDFDWDQPVTYELAREVALNVATRTQVVGELDVSLAAHINHDLREDLSGGLGVEASYWPFSGLTFAARAGARFGLQEFANPRLNGATIESGRFTAGGGVSWQRLTLDYAWEPFTGATDAHRIGLRVR